MCRSRKSGGATFVDLGNAPSFVYTPTVEKKEHFQSREGIKTKDFTAITQVGATIKVQLDEITGLNLSFFALGDLDTTTPGEATINGLSKAEFVGDIKVDGTNDIGQQVDFNATVSFVPSGDFSFITDSDDFTVIELEAEVQKGTDRILRCLDCSGSGEWRDRKRCSRQGDLAEGTETWLICWTSRRRLRSRSSRSTACASKCAAFRFDAIASIVVAISSLEVARRRRWRYRTEVDCGIRHGDWADYCGRLRASEMRMPMSSRRQTLLPEQQLKLLRAIVGLTFPNGIRPRHGGSDSYHEQRGARHTGKTPQGALEEIAIAVTALVRRGFPPTMQ